MNFLDFGFDLVQKVLETIKNVAKSHGLYAVEVKPLIRRKDFTSQKETHKGRAIFRDDDGNYYLLKIKCEPLDIEADVVRVGKVEVKKVDLSASLRKLAKEEVELWQMAGIEPLE